MDQVGRFEIGKLFHLVSIILQIYYRRIREQSEALYYPPAGPNRVPMYRDMIILISTRWLFRKTIFHMQASGISEMYPKLGALGKFLFRAAYFHPDAVIRLSEHTVDDTSGLKAKREFLIPNSSEDELPRFSPTGAANANSDPIQLLYLGTVCESKGIRVLLQACGQLAKNGYRFHLDIVGSFQPAQFEGEIKSEIGRLNITSQCRLLGQLTGDEKFARFAQADIFCFPSHYECEAFPCVLVEAMSFGIPIVSTQWRGIRSIVQQDKTGILVPIKSPQAVEQAITHLIESPEVRDQMGKKARESFLENYTTKSHIERMETMFQSVRDSDKKRQRQDNKNPITSTVRI